MRRDFINAWLEQRPVDAYARQVLNFFEDVGVFLQKDWVGDDVAYELLSAWVLHYWDASAPFVATESAIAPDSWDKTAEMVDTFHKLAGASAFARTCTPQMITRFFRRELAELDTFDDSHA